MSSQKYRDLLVRGVAAAKAKEKDEARFYLERFLRYSQYREGRAKAWLWLSEVSDDLAEKRNCLEEVLAHDPANMLARRGLAILDGRLDPDDIIDPDQPPEPPPKDDATPVSGQRYVCQQCGGKMAFQADGKTLECNYCGDTQPLLRAIQAGAMVQEQDFAVTMATIKGHASPVGVHPFTCQACGASFVLAPDVLSINCAYCGSAHVIELPETQRLIMPEGVLAFEVTEDQARKAFNKWLKKKNLRKVQVSPVRGMYVPAWTFDLVGEIRWQCTRYEDESNYGMGGAVLSLGRRSVHGRRSGYSRRKVREKGSYPVYEDDMLVPASHKLPPDLIMNEAKRFVLEDVAPYDPGYLANWPAEVYRIPVSDASLVARRRLVEKMRRFLKTRLRAKFGSVQDMQFNTASVVVESFKLILLPIWVTHYRREEQSFDVIINGQMGKVRGQVHEGGLRKFFRGILG